MSNKKENIKNGKNIEIDGITVINEGISLAEKEEKKEAEVAVDAEVKAEEPEIPVEQEPEITPDVKIAPEVTPEAEVPSSAEVPHIDINNVLPDIGAVDLTSAEPSVEPSVEVNAETQEQPTFDVGGADVPQGSPFNYEPETNQSSTFSFVNDSQQDEVKNYTPEAETKDSGMFGDAYTDSYEKVEATVVTEEDAKEAKNAFIDTMNKVYDNGPGRQIEILRKVAEDATKWISEVVEKGFVSGPMHESAKKIMNDYHGLRLKDEPSDTNNYTNEEQPKFYDETPSEQYTDFNNDINGYSRAA